jgi:hypothetical protein
MGRTKLWIAACAAALTMAVPVVAQADGFTVGRLTATAATGTLAGPNLHNHHATASLVVHHLVPQCGAVRIRDRFDVDDLVPTVQVFVNGHRRSTLHGHNLRWITFRPPPGLLSFALRLVFIQGDHRYAVAERHYSGCGAGPTHWRFVTPPGAVNEA